MSNIKVLSVFTKILCWSLSLYKFCHAIQNNFLEVQTISWRTEVIRGTQRPRQSCYYNYCNTIGAIVTSVREGSILWQEVAQSMGITMGNTHKIILEHLILNHVCAKWMPRLLISAQKSASSCVPRTKITGTWLWWGLFKVYNYLWWNSSCLC